MYIVSVVWITSILYLIEPFNGNILELLELILREPGP